MLNSSLTTAFNVPPYNVESASFCRGYSRPVVVILMDWSTLNKDTCWLREGEEIKRDDKCWSEKNKSNSIFNINEPLLKKDKDNKNTSD